MLYRVLTLLSVVACHLLAGHLAVLCQTQVQKPRLVVQISFDQMRADYIARFAPFFNSDGFLRLVRDGTSFSEASFKHATNMTCPGHAIIGTGVYPWRNGIVANDFFVDSLKKVCYCVENTSPKKGVPEIRQRSPSLMKHPTFADELLGISPKSKVVGVAHKDRAAILMSGKMPRTVLWFDEKSLSFVTSDYYQEPKWLKAFNATSPVARFAGAEWQTVLPNRIGAQDSVPQEHDFPGGTFRFPHRLPAVSNDTNFADAYLSSPFAISHIFELSRHAIEQSALGTDSVPDLISIGVSTTDILGHLFGPDSRELQELYVHADTVLASFLTFLDRKIGRQQYLVVVSADHGVAPIPEVITGFGPVGVDAGRLDRPELKRTLESAMYSRFPSLPADSKLMDFFAYSTIRLNRQLLEWYGIPITTASDSLAIILAAQPGIEFALPFHRLNDRLWTSKIDPTILDAIRLDYDPSRSGDIYYLTKIFWLAGKSAATTHYTPWDYDRRVPLIFFQDIKGRGLVEDISSPVDIKATLGKVLGISLDNGDGRPLQIFE